MWCGSAHAVALGYGSLFNHDNPASLRYEADPGNLSLRFIATRDIAAGEELTINYNAPQGKPRRSVPTGLPACASRRLSLRRKADARRTLALESNHGALVAPLLLLLLAACVGQLPSAEQRGQYMDAAASAHHWEKLRLPSGNSVLTAYAPPPEHRNGVLTIYIEGDGLAWLSRARPSDDPTPNHALGLQLALRHPDNAVAYLARPCQNTAPADWGGAARRTGPGAVFSGGDRGQHTGRRYSQTPRRGGKTVGYSGAPSPRWWPRSAVMSFV